MIKRSILIHGAAGCGKTKAAEALRQFYGLGMVLDEWPQATGFALSPYGVLYLSDRTPPGNCPIKTIPFAVAMEEAGLPIFNRRSRKADSTNQEGE